METIMSRKEALAAGQKAVNEARWAQAKRLQDELNRLARDYIVLYDDKQLALENMCDAFMQRTAATHYPGGWGGMVNYALRRAR